jgi:hypothetical protein
MKKSDSGKFPKTNALREEYISTYGYIFNAYHDDPEEFPILDMELEALEEEFTPRVSKVYLSESRSYKKRGVFYKGCTFQEYQKHYPERLKAYINIYGEDVTEEDFIVDELNNLQVNTFLLDEQITKTIGFSLRKAENYLKQRLSSLDFDLIAKSGQDKITYEYKRRAQTTIENEGQEDDFNDSSPRLNGPQRTILLYELGIVDLIKGKIERGWSTNKIASIVAEITGEKRQTVQPRINPIENPQSGGQNKNPYNREGSKEKVQDFLRKHDVFI